MAPAPSARGSTRRGGAATVAGLLLLAGCSAPIALPPEPAPASESGGPGPDRPLFPYRPDPDPAEPVPARLFPEPAELGPRWSVLPFPALAGESAEAGEVVVRQLDAEAVAASLAVSCRSIHPSPTPTSAAATRYRRGDLTVGALLLRFRTAGQARAFGAARTADLSACRAKVGGGLEARGAGPASGAALGRDYVQLAVVGGHGDPSVRATRWATRLLARFRARATAG